MLATHTDVIGLTTLMLVLASWVVFVLSFGLRARSAKVTEAKRAPAATAGLALQGVAFVLVWTFRRSHWWPFPSSPSVEFVMGAVAVALAWAGSVCCLWSVRVLGKQWAPQARVIEGHELITSGPYSIVRNPIYLGMFGQLVATGLTLSAWWALLGAVSVFLAGTQIRIRTEEGLLREAFGPEFADYVSRVPAFLPRIF
jgi:protein-S-isoprenylcysteine O-methyltransferase Ste14